MSFKHSCESGKVHILGLLDLLCCTLSLLLLLNLVSNVQSATIVSLQVGFSKPEVAAVFLNWLKEAISNQRNDLLLLDLLKVVSDLLTEGHTVISSAHELLNLLHVVLGASILERLDHGDVLTNIVGTDMLDEFTTVTD